MNRSHLLALAAMAIIAGTSAAAWADPKDYAFTAVSDHVAASSAAPIAVRLVHLPTRKPVTDAIILPAKLEMPMAGMPPMVSKVTPLGPDGAGAYKLVGDMAMAGTYTLVLQAKVQGEAGTITGTIPLVAESGHAGHHD